MHKTWPGLEALTLARENACKCCGRVEVVVVVVAKDLSIGVILLQTLLNMKKATTLHRDRQQTILHIPMVQLLFAVIVNTHTLSISLSLSLHLYLSMYVCMYVCIYLCASFVVRNTLKPFATHFPLELKKSLLKLILSEPWGGTASHAYHWHKILKRISLVRCYEGHHQCQCLLAYGERHDTATVTISESSSRNSA